jgi:lysophospholipase L1-like esterase
MDTIAANASRLVDTINHDYPRSLIIIAMPTTCEKTGSGWIASYKSMDNFERYQLRIRQLWKILYEKYAYGRYKSNIQVSYDGLCIDRENGYPKNNGVHPSPEGYRQLARGFSNTLNYYLRNFKSY